MSVAQRLTRTFANDKSKKAVDVPESVSKMYEESISNLPPEFQEKLLKPEHIFEPVPSSEFPIGLKGRLPVLEMFKIDKEMQHLILSSPKEDDIYKLARGKGMLTMREDAFQKAFAGKIPFKEVYSL